MSPSNKHHISKCNVNWKCDNKITETKSKCICNNNTTTETIKITSNSRVYKTMYQNTIAT